MVTNSIFTKYIINLLCFIFKITTPAPLKPATDLYSLFCMCFLLTIACYSNFQMAGVIVNSSTHVPISPWSIPQTSNRNVRCDCTALIWNIHLTCEMLCCHLPCVNSMASIIEGLGRGRLEALCGGPERHGQSERRLQQTGPEHLPAGLSSPASERSGRNTDLAKVK